MKTLHSVDTLLDAATSWTRILVRCHVLLNWQLYHVSAMPLILGFSISFHAFQDTLIHAVFKSKAPLASLHVTKADKTHRWHTPYVGAKMVSSRIHIGEVGSRRVYDPAVWVPVHWSSLVMSYEPPTSKTCWRDMRLRHKQSAHCGHCGT